jgi:O-acetyl-ADP-ribose deacetylase (regulator of RNase III)
MPITELRNRNLLHDDADALVNTVNCVGVMGKGLALAFKQSYPAMFEAYRADCRRGLVATGRMYVWANPNGSNPRLIINFPTKQHWRDRSQLEWIASGLEDLVDVIGTRRITSIAVPPLGCGLGGLHWPAVRELIHWAFTTNAPDVDLRLYLP